MAHRESTIERHRRRRGAATRAGLLGAALTLATIATLSTTHGCAWGPGAPFCDFDGGDGGCVGGLDAGASDAAVADGGDGGLDGGSDAGASDGGGTSSVDGGDAGP